MGFNPQSESEGYRCLVLSIMLQAKDDASGPSRRRKIGEERIRPDEGTRREVETFVSSDWFGRLRVLTGNNPDDMARAILAG